MAISETRRQTRISPPPPGCFPGKRFHFGRFQADRRKVCDVCALTASCSTPRPYANRNPQNSVCPRRPPRGLRRKNIRERKSSRLQSHCLQFPPLARRQRNDKTEQRWDQWMSEIEQILNLGLNPAALE
jgi:hypothetical protein